MKWAFWRRRRPRATRPGRSDARQGEVADTEELAVDPAGVRIRSAAQIRVRMRRRLIGAAALLLGTAVVVPMMLDPTPRPLPDNIPIDIPSERTPFSPRLSLPPSFAPGTEGKASVPGASEGKPSEEQGVKSGKAPDSSKESSSPAAAGEADSPSIAPGTAAGSPAEASGTKVPDAKAGQWFVQAAALSNENAARQLSERLTKAGMTPFVERSDNGGKALYRVRLGPFESRDAAVKARRHLRAMAIGSNVVRVEQAER